MYKRQDLFRAVVQKVKNANINVIFVVIRVHNQLNMSLPTFFFEELPRDCLLLSGVGLELELGWASFDSPTLLHNLDCNSCLEQPANTLFCFFEYS